MASSGPTVALNAGGGSVLLFSITPGATRTLARTFGQNSACQKYLRQHEPTKKQMVMTMAMSLHIVNADSDADDDEKL